jgi:hypothetical protein
MVRADRPRKAVGTYGFLDVLRRPALMFWPPDPSGQGDIRAVCDGGALVVSCFLRGTFAPYPARLTYGTLTLSARLATWKPYFRFPRHPLSITIEADSVTTRPVSGWREWNVKKELFAVVTGTGPSGSADFVVPNADVRLVTAWLNKTLDAEKPCPPRL